MLSTLSLDSGPEIIRIISVWLPLVPVIILSCFFGTLWRLLSKERSKPQEGATAKGSK